MQSRPPLDDQDEVTEKSRCSFLGILSRVIGTVRQINKTSLCIHFILLYQQLNSLAAAQDTGGNKVSSCDDFVGQWKGTIYQRDWLFLKDEPFNVSVEVYKTTHRWKGFRCSGGECERPAWGGHFSVFNKKGEHEFGVNMANVGTCAGQPASGELEQSDGRCFHTRVGMYLTSPTKANIRVQDTWYCDYPTNSKDLVGSVNRVEEEIRQGQRPK